MGKPLRQCSWQSFVIPQSLTTTPLKPYFFRSRSGRELGVEAAGDLLDGLALDGDSLKNGVDRHDAAHLGLKGTEVRRDVVLEVVAGEGGEPAVVVVAIPTVLLSAVAHPMLDDGNHGAGIQAVASILEALDVGLDKAAGEVSVLTEGTVNAGPAWLGGEIRLRRECFADADSDVFLAGDVGELADEGGVANGGEACGLGPAGEGTGLDGGALHIAEMVAGIGGDGNGNAEVGRLSQLLDAVVLCGEKVRRAG